MFNPDPALFQHILMRQAPSVDQVTGIIYIYRLPAFVLTVRSTYRTSLWTKPAITVPADL